MRFEQLEYLIKINNHKSMHAAARELHISQQSISKAMRDLEEELGVQLFTRSSMGTQLTKEGQELLPHAINIMQEVAMIQHKHGISPPPEKCKKSYTENIYFQQYCSFVLRFCLTIQSNA